MKLLADTHTFLWFILDDPALSGRAKELLEDPTSERLLSIGSLWEIAIKHSLGKLSLAKPFAEFIPEQLQQNRFQVLDLRVEHLAGVAPCLSITAILLTGCLLPRVSRTTCRC